MKSISSYTLHSKASKFKLAYLVVIVSTVGMLLWMLAAGNIEDDYSYSRCLIEFDNFRHEPNQAERAYISFWACEGEPIETWNDVWDSIVNHYLAINGRLSNMIALASTMFPSWAIDLAHAFLYTLLLLQILKIIDREWRWRPLLTLAVAASLWIVLPWEDSLASSDYTMNYVWASAINLLFINKLQKFKSSTNNHPRIISLSVLALAAGMIHEGFSIPIFTALMVLEAIDFVYNRQKWHQNKSRFLILTLYLLGAIIVVASPGLWLLLDMRKSWHPDTKFFIYTLGVRLWPMYLMLLLTIVTANIMKQERKELIYRNIFWFVAVLVCCYISLKSVQGGRALWMAYLASAIGCWNAVALLTRGRFQKNWMKLSGKIIFIFGLFLFSGWLLTLAYYQNKATNEQAIVEQELIKTRNNIVYADVMVQGDIPWWLFEIPQHINNAGCGSRMFLHASVMKSEEPRLMIFPKRYQTIPFDSIPLIGGNAGLRGDYPTFYSDKRLSSPTTLLLYGNPDRFKPTGSVNPVYGLPRTLANLKGEVADTLKVTRNLEETYSVCHGDTTWFYRVIYVGRSLSGLRLLGIDTIPTH